MNIQEYILSITPDTCKMLKFWYSNNFGHYLSAKFILLKLNIEGTNLSLFEKEKGNVWETQRKRAEQQQGE